jgi:hypothetical protein
MGGVKITDRDAGYRNLVAQSKKVKPTTIRIGVNDGEHHDAGGLKTAVAGRLPKTKKPMKNDELGAIHEFGLGDNPQRSFLRAWLDDESLWLPKLERELEGLMTSEGDDAGTSMKRFATFAVGSVRDRMRRGIAPALKPSTVARKLNGSTPLIETEQLIKAIEFEIKEGA